MTDFVSWMNRLPDVLVYLVLALGAAVENLVPAIPAGLRLVRALFFLGGDHSVIPLGRYNYPNNSDRGGVIMKQMQEFSVRTTISLGMPARVDALPLLDPAGITRDFAVFTYMKIRVKSGLSTAAAPSTLHVTDGKQDYDSTTETLQESSAAERI